MNIKSVLGDQYKDGMTVEDLLALDVNVVMKKRFDEVASEAAGFKKQLQANMSEAELKAAKEAEERKKLLEERDELSKKIKTIETAKQYMSIGYDEKFATETATALLNGDIAAVLKAQAKFVEEQKRSVLAEAMKSQSTPPAGNNGGSTMTLEVLKSMSQTDRMKFAQEHTEEYKKLYSGGNNNNG